MSFSLNKDIILLLLLLLSPTLIVAEVSRNWLKMGVKSPLFQWKNTTFPFISAVYLIVTCWNYIVYYGLLLWAVNQTKLIRLGRVYAVILREFVLFFKLRFLVILKLQKCVTIFYCLWNHAWNPSNCTYSSLFLKVQKNLSQFHVRKYSIQIDNEPTITTPTCTHQTYTLLQKKHKHVFDNNNQGLLNHLAAAWKCELAAWKSSQESARTIICATAIMALTRICWL